MFDRDVKVSRVTSRVLNILPCTCASYIGQSRIVRARNMYSWSIDECLTLDMRVSIRNVLVYVFSENVGAGMSYLHSYYTLIHADMKRT